MANKISEAFDQIQADPQLKQATRRFLAEKRAKRRRWYQQPALRWAASVCMILLLAAGIGGFSLVRTPVSYVSIDVNPSIELALNRFDRVVSAEAYNEEGKDILKDISLDLKGASYQEAVDAVIRCPAMRRYLTGDSEIYITVAADKEKEPQLKAGAEESCRRNGHGCHYNSTEDADAVQQARACGMSLGKYLAYLQLSQYEEVTPDDCRHMTMSEMHGRTQEHRQGEHPTDSTSEPGHGGHSGSGTQSGQGSNATAEPGYNSSAGSGTQSGQGSNAIAEPGYNSSAGSGTQSGQGSNATAEPEYNSSAGSGTQSGQGSSSVVEPWHGGHSGSGTQSGQGSSSTAEPWHGGHSGSGTQSGQGSSSTAEPWHGGHSGSGTQSGQGSSSTAEPWHGGHTGSGTQSGSAPTATPVPSAGSGRHQQKRHGQNHHD